MHVCLCMYCHLMPSVDLILGAGGKLFINSNSMISRHKHYGSVSVEQCRYSHETKQSDLFRSSPPLLTLSLSVAILLPFICGSNSSLITGTLLNNIALVLILLLIPEFVKTQYKPHFPVESRAQLKAVMECCALVLQIGFQ